MKDKSLRDLRLTLRSILTIYSSATNTDSHSYLLVILANVCDV